MYLGSAISVHPFVNDQSTAANASTKGVFDSKNDKI